MATGGAAGEEEFYSFELFVCSVCFESLINKQPRLLSCGHTFCTPCLQKLPGRYMINCPKCRSPTRLPQEGLKALPINTDISKMREREQELAGRNDYYCQMCRNRDAKVEFFCTGCPKGQICEECYNKHQRFPALKGHQIFPIEKKIESDKNHEQCKDHCQLLEYFCTTCEKAICVVCMCEHEQHGDKIEDFKTGLQKLKESICCKFKENTKKVEVCAEILKLEKDSLEKFKEVMSAKCEEVETILNQMKKQLQDITELYEPLKNAYSKINTHFANVQKQMTEMNELNECSDLNKIKECRKICDDIMNDAEIILNRTIKIPENIKQHIKIEGNVVPVITKEVPLKEKIMAYSQQCVAATEKPQTTAGPRQTDIKNELNNLELMSEIMPGGTVDMSNPSEVVSVGDGTVILVDQNLNCLQRINTEGKVVRKYQVGQPLNQRVNYVTACVYRDSFFVATSDNVITKMPLDGPGCNIIYKPEGVETLDYVTALGDNALLISGGGYHSYGILEYNTKTNQVIERLSGICNTGKVNVVQDDHHTKYIVNAIQKYNIYNREWNLISTIDIYHDVLTVTPGGKLLIAYNNRIHEYSQDGTYIRELLDRYKFKEIRDITCDGQYLWVLDKFSGCIKILVSN